MACRCLALEVSSLGVGATGRSRCRSTLLPDLVTVNGTASRGAVGTAGLAHPVVPRGGRAFTRVLGATVEAAPVCVASLVRTTGTGLAGPVTAPTPVYGRCLEGLIGSPCPCAQALGTAVGRGAANVRPVGAAGACPLATRRFCRGCAPGPADAAGLAACVASTAISSAAATLRPGRRFRRPSFSLGV